MDKEVQPAWIKIFSHMWKTTYTHFTRQEVEQGILYRRCTEQFKIHFRDVHNGEIE